MLATVIVDAGKAAGRRLLAPIGITTPHKNPLACRVDGAAITLTGEANTGQMAAVLTPVGVEPVKLTYETTGPGSAYPLNLFVYRSSPFSRAANQLVAEARRLAADTGDGNAGIAAIVNDVAGKFTYGHPETRFNDGLDQIPLLSCGLTEGSCVEINACLIAALRAAGFEAGYVTGYFFPAEKRGRCDDMHCWVVSRHEGVVLEWDIAHHLKLGVRKLKLLAEPVWVDAAGAIIPAEVAIRMKLN